MASQAPNVAGDKERSGVLAARLAARAAERLRRRSLPIVALSAVENPGVDPQLDLLVAQREEVSHLLEVARELLNAREYEILRPAESRVARSEVASRLDLTPRQVKRVLERTHAKLNAGQAELREHGHCGLVARVIANIQSGAIEPNHPQWTAGVENFARCRRRRSSSRFVARMGDEREPAVTTAKGA
jgi:hypothetical protein